MTMIGTQSFYDRSIADMAALRGRADKLQQSVSTGQKLARSSDDPVAASRLRLLSRSEALATVDAINANRAEADLTLADNALTSMAGLVIRATELTTQAAGVGLTLAQRASIGVELSEIHKGLLSLANNRDSAGHALFGGQSAGNTYALDASGQAVYSGADGKPALQIGEGVSVNPGLTGPEILDFEHGGTNTNLLATVKNVADALSSGSVDPARAARDALGALNEGLDALTTGQTIIGSRLGWIEQTNDMRVNQSEIAVAEQAKIGGTDIAETLSRLQQITTALEASQAGFSRLSRLSLFDAIR